MRIPLKLLAVHRENRSGLFPSPARVQVLGCSILLQGLNTMKLTTKELSYRSCRQVTPGVSQKLGVSHETFRAYNFAKVIIFDETSTRQFGLVGKVHFDFAKAFPATRSPRDYERGAAVAASDAPVA